MRPAYNAEVTSYNARPKRVALMSYVMKVSSNGQVSIPAGVRERWKANEVVVVDMGDQIVMRPRSSDPIAALMGKDKGRGPSSDELRKAEREEEVARERRRYE